MEFDWKPYVSIAKQRDRAAREIKKLRKLGRLVLPVEVVGRKIATTFWGESWCLNLEIYSDYANRLPRGRSYVRNGFVIDLQIEKGRVEALVSGTEFYEVEIEIKPLAKQRWKTIKSQCGTQIDSMVELLQGKISKSVMEIVTRQDGGLFPSPGEIFFDCTCPDSAMMCKHIAAVLYGAGVRLDNDPNMLFVLRGVDPVEMIAAVTDVSAVTAPRRSSRRVLKTGDLSSVFGIELDATAASDEQLTSPPVRRTRKKAPAKAARKKKVTTIRPEKLR
jgi:uncharacterized Zn finger protein